jgi:hypothetical protein
MLDQEKLLDPTTNEFSSKHEKEPKTEQDWSLVEDSDEKGKRPSHRRYCPVFAKLFQFDRQDTGIISTRDEIDRIFPEVLHAHHGRSSTTNSSRTAWSPFI